jgi:serine phosphatase RsbU (regulator of sigma subunit)
MKQKSLQEHFKTNHLKPFWEDQSIFMTENQAHINLFVPFSDKSNQPKGFVGFNMNLAWVDTLLHSALTYYRNDTRAFMFMMTVDGIAVSVAGNIIEKNKNLIKETNDDDAFISMIYNMRNGETESIKLKNTYTKAANMFFYKSLTNKRISIALSYCENQSMNAWNRLFMMGMGALLFSFSIITLWLWWYWKKRTKMSDRIGEILDEIGQKGSTTAVLPSSSQHQDLEELCVKIENMQRGLEQRDRDLVSGTKVLERRDHEREIAQNIRQYFCPSVFQPYNASLSPKIQQHIKTDYLDDVGGDFHDFFRISSQLICFVTGTVSRPKKSMSNIQTSMDILMTMNLIRSHLKGYSSLDECVFYLNNDLYSQNYGRFTVNMFIGVINCETGVLDYINAGAPSHYMISHRGIFSCPGQNGSPLALKPNEKYSLGNEKFSDGDMMLTYTAGALSRQNTTSERYGQKRLEEIMAASKKMNPDMFLEKIVEDIADFTKTQLVQVDDYTLLAVKYEEKNVPLQH